MNNLENEEKEPFQITDTGSLNFVFREILQPLLKRIDEVKSLAKTELERITEWEEKELNGPLRDVEYWEHRIAEYHLSLLQEDPSQKTISTPYGKSKTTTSKEQPEKVDDKQLLEYVKENKLTNFLKIEESVKWGDLKKSLKVVGNNVVDEDGVIVKGVKVKPKTISCKVEVK